MKKEFENELYNIDPVFFEQAIACTKGEMDETNTCMYFGCECGDGWFEPIKKFIKKIKIINTLLKEYNQKIVCSQLKEKFGELRIYYSFDLIDKNKKEMKAPQELFDMVNDAYETAVQDCWNVCEWCGADGGFNGENLITTSGWISRICKKCSKAAMNKDVEHYDEFNKLKHIPRITSFSNGYNFLSIFHPSFFTFNDKNYSSIIEAFCAIKGGQRFEKIIQILNTIKNDFNKGKIIKSIAEEFNIKFEDNETDYSILKDIVRVKFNYKWNKDFKQELIETKDKLLQNMGRHHDNVLGYCICDECRNKEHKDIYAKILMEIREEFLNE